MFPLCIHSQLLHQGGFLHQFGCLYIYYILPHRGYFPFHIQNYKVALGFQLGNFLYNSVWGQVWVLILTLGVYLVFSIILTEVPLGPGTLATTSLNLFARVEPWVVGTIRVAVAPLSLNQVALSVFSTCFLWAFDL